MKAVTNLMQEKCDLICNAADTLSHLTDSLKLWAMLTNDNELKQRLEEKAEDILSTPFWISSTANSLREDILNLEVELDVRNQ